jgi:competence protein ComEA
MKLPTPVVAAVAGIALAAGAARAYLRPPPPHTDFVVGAAASPSNERRPPPRDTPAPGPPRIVVYVAGAVVRPGLYRLLPAARTADAVRAAGGLRPEADPVAVNLAAPVSDGEEVAVPAKGDPGDAGPPASAAAGTYHRVRGARIRRKHRNRHRRSAASEGDAAAGSGTGPSTMEATGGGAAAPAAAPKSDVDLNTAGPDELASLPGVGPAMAERIIEFREQNGPFTSIDDLLDVGGMSEGKLDELAPYVTTRAP